MCRLIILFCFGLGSVMSISATEYAFLYTFDSQKNEITLDGRYNDGKGPEKDFQETMLGTDDEVIIYVKDVPKDIEIGIGDLKTGMHVVTEDVSSNNLNLKGDGSVRKFSTLAILQKWSSDRTKLTFHDKTNSQALTLVSGDMLVFEQKTEPQNVQTNSAGGEGGDVEMSLEEQLNKNGIVLKFKKNKNLAGLIRTNPEVKAEPNKQIFVEINHLSNSKYKVEIDTVSNDVYLPTALFLGLDETSASAKSSADRGDSPMSPIPIKTYYEIGSFDEGKKVVFSIKTAGNYKKKETEDITEVALDKSSLKKALRKTEGKHEEVNLEELLKQNANDNNEYQVKYKTTNTKITWHVDPGREEVDRKVTTSEKVEWKKYDDILKDYKSVIAPKKEKKVENLKFGTPKWQDLSSYSIKTPKYYRYRLRAGFVGAKIKTSNFGVRVRDALPSDAPQENAVLDFDVTSFKADTTTQVVKIDNDVVERWDVKPLLLLTIYPFNKKNLRDDKSLFGGAAGMNMFSFSLGTTLTKDGAFRDYYLGGSFEIIQGIDLFIGGLIYTLSEYKLPKPFDDIANQQYLTNFTPIKEEFFAEDKKRKVDFSAGVHMDAIIFQKSFQAVNSLLKNVLTGNDDEKKE